MPMRLRRREDGEKTGPGNVDRRQIQRVLGPQVNEVGLDWSRMYSGPARGSSRCPAGWPSPSNPHLHSPVHCRRRWVHQRGRCRGSERREDNGREGDLLDPYAGHPSDGFGGASSSRDTLDDDPGGNVLHNERACTHSRIAADLEILQDGRMGTERDAFAEHDVA